MKLLHSIIFISMGVSIFSQNDSLVTAQKRFEIPLIDSSEILIDHYAYSLVYSEQHEQARWIAYQLTKNELDGPHKRTDRFIEDPLVETGSATIEDYKKSGYDRGHLAPAADMKWSDTAMYESFYFSNMSPQDPGFNRGIWRKLEAKVRDWANDFDSLYIVTGPILSDSLSSIGKNKVSIPKFYYKALLSFGDSSIHSIAFILPNQSSSKPIASYACSIDSLESVSGIDIFPLLSDDFEEETEQNIYLKYWFNNQSQSTTNKTDEPFRCKGITNAGKRCKRKTKNKSGYCYQHEK